MSNNHHAPTEPSTSNHLVHAYVPAFDGIRATVFTVMFVHLEDFFPIFAGHRKTTFLLFDHTWFTLNIFFCLSGFLITWLLTTEMQRTGSLDLLRFYKRRTVRLLPAYLSAILISTAIAIFMWGFSLKEIARESPLFLTYTYNMFRSFSANTAPMLGLFLTPVWSLCVEEQFYFGWSIALKRLTLRRALPAVICALIAQRVYRCALLFWMQGHGYSYFTIDHRFYFGTDTRIEAILVGCAAALMLQNRRYYEIARKYLASKSLPYFLPIGVAIIVFFTAPYGITSGAYQSYGAEVSLVLLAAWFVSLLFQPESAVSRILGSRPFKFLGRISYGLYIFHFILIQVLARVMGVFTSPYSLNRNIAGWALVMAGSIVFATVHYEFIEKPLMGRFKSSVPRPDVSETEKVLAMQTPGRRPAYSRPLGSIIPS